MKPFTHLTLPRCNGCQSLVELNSESCLIRERWRKEHQLLTGFTAGNTPVHKNNACQHCHHWCFRTSWTLLFITKACLNQWKKLERFHVEQRIKKCFNAPSSDTFWFLSLSGWVSVHPVVFRDRTFDEDPLMCLPKSCETQSQGGHTAFKHSWAFESGSWPNVRASPTFWFSAREFSGLSEKEHKKLRFGCLQGVMLQLQTQCS